MQLRRFGRLNFAGFDALMDGRKTSNLALSEAIRSSPFFRPATPVERLTGPDGVYRMTLFSRRLDMARKSKLTQAAVKIGTAIGKADRTAHQIAKAGLAAKDELADIAAQINTLKRQLLKTKKRLQRALK
jgi:hypothetical protein